MFRRILVSFIVIILLAFLFWSSFSLQEIFYEMVASIEEYAAENEILVAAVFIGLSALSAMLSPFTSALFVPAVVIIWGNVLTATFLFLGWILGAIAAYFIGSYAGHTFVKELPSSEKIKYYRERLSEKTKFILVLLFRIAMPAEIPGYVLGIVRYSFSKYLLATIIAELPFAIIMVFASDALINEQPFIFTALVVSAFLTIGIVFYFFHKRI